MKGVSSGVKAPRKDCISIKRWLLYYQMMANWNKDCIDVFEKVSKHGVDLAVSLEHCRKEYVKYQHAADLLRSGKHEKILTGKWR